MNDLQKNPENAALMRIFDAAMKERAYHTPMHSPFDNCFYLNQRDEDRFEGFRLAIEGKTLASLGLAHEELEKWKTISNEQAKAMSALIKALRTANNGLRHCARWNISEEKEKALMSVVLENENILAGTAGAIDG